MHQINQKKNVTLFLNSIQVETALYYFLYFQRNFPIISSIFKRFQSKTWLYMATLQLQLRKWPFR